MNSNQPLSLSPVNETPAVGPKPQTVKSRKKLIIALVTGVVVVGILAIIATFMLLNRGPTDEDYIYADAALTQIQDERRALLYTAEQYATGIRFNELMNGDSFNKFDMKARFETYMGKVEELSKSQVQKDDDIKQSFNDFINDDKAFVEYFRSFAEAEPVLKSMLTKCKNTSVIDSGNDAEKRLERHKELAEPCIAAFEELSKVGLKELSEDAKIKLPLYKKRITTAERQEAARKTKNAGSYVDAVNAESDITTEILDTETYKALEAKTKSVKKNEALDTFSQRLMKKKYAL